MINTAASRFRIKELANLAEVFVFLAAHHTLVAMGGFKIFLLGFFGCEVKVTCNTRCVFVFHLNHRVRTAIARTFQTIIFGFLRHRHSQKLNRRIVYRRVEATIQQVRGKRKGRGISGGIPAQRWQARRRATPEIEGQRRVLAKKLKSRLSP
jgi:hypothetical protein